MLGSDVLVAPVLSADGQVTYYVPAGTWTHLLTGEQVNGPAWVTEKHGFDSLPVLVRPGAVIPFGGRSDRPDYDWADDVRLRLYAPAEGQRTRVRIPSPGDGPGAEFDVRYEDGAASAELVVGASTGYHLRDPAGRVGTMTRHQLPGELRLGIGDGLVPDRGRGRARTAAGRRSGTPTATPPAGR